MIAGFAAPIVVALLGIAVFSGGCAKEGDGAVTSARPMIAFTSHVPVAHAKGHPGRRDARTYTGGSGGPQLFAAIASPSDSLTPLDELLAEGDRPLPMNGLCPADMASIDDRYCIDRYEASLVEVLPNGDERAWSAFDSVEGHLVRALSEPGVIPQGYVSEIQAKDACARSGKRLCAPSEWRKACMGPEKTTYGYGNDSEPNRCNDSGRSPVTALYGSQSDLGDQAQWDWSKMNDPQLNQLDRTVAKTGSHEGCTNGYGVYDMVGNLHEWVADPRGTFQGGYYQDTHINGDGCTYKTMAHAAWYHDYSTGFRCCADVAQ